jgi:MerR family transcriptional regulator, copper efflux regulator
VRIGEVAFRAGLTAKAIRYYERVGLLPPPRRTDSGYRDYDAAALDRLGFVLAARTAGLTLGEIRGVLALRDRGQAPCGHVLALIERRERELEARISDLARRRRGLAALAERARELDPADCRPEGVCHVIGAGR